MKGHWILNSGPCIPLSNTDILMDYSLFRRGIFSAKYLLQKYMYFFSIFCHFLWLQIEKILVDLPFKCCNSWFPLLFHTLWLCQIPFACRRRVKVGQSRNSWIFYFFFWMGSVDGCPDASQRLSVQVLNVVSWYHRCQGQNITTVLSPLLSHQLFDRSSTFYFHTV